MLTRVIEDSKLNQVNIPQIIYPTYVKTTQLKILQQMKLNFQSKKKIADLAVIDDQFIALLLTDGMIELWSIDNKHRQTIKVHKYAFPGCLFFNQISRCLYSVANEHLAIFKFKSNHMLSQVYQTKKFKNYISEFFYLECLDCFFVSYYEQEMHYTIWNRTLKKQLSEFVHKERSIQKFVNFLPLRKMIVFEDEFGGILFDAESSSFIDSFDCPYGSLMSIFEINEETLISAQKLGKEKSLILWEYKEKILPLKLIVLEFERILLRLDQERFLLNSKEGINIFSVEDKSVSRHADMKIEGKIWCHSHEKEKISVVTSIGGIQLTFFRLGALDTKTSETLCNLF